MSQAVVAEGSFCGCRSPMDSMRYFTIQKESGKGYTFYIRSRQNYADLCATIEDNHKLRAACGDKMRPATGDAWKYAAGDKKNTELEDIASNLSKDMSIGTD